MHTSSLQKLKGCSHLFLQFHKVGVLIALVCELRLKASHVALWLAVLLEPEVTNFGRDGGALEDALPG